VAGRPRSLVAGLSALALSASALAQVARSEPTLSFGAVSFYNPRVMYLKYQPFVDYLGRHTPYRWRLVVFNSYEQTVTALCRGDLALAYLGPLTYVRAHASCGALPVVRLNTGGSATYRSVIMVRRDSPILGLADLAGKSFGFGSPLGTSSHLVPLHMLMAAGLDPGKNVRCVYYDHHERAARAVLLGEVDACGVRDIVGEKFEQGGLRVLETSPPIPNFPLAVRADAPADLRQSIVHALVVEPTEDSAVYGAMAGWDEEFSAGFAISEDVDFDPIRRLALIVFGPSYLNLPPAALRRGPERR
jgi:phosphonate transport system substrate-binding protein